MSQRTDPRTSELNKHIADLDALIVRQSQVIADLELANESLAQYNKDLLASTRKRRLDQLQKQRNGAYQRGRKDQAAEDRVVAEGLRDELLRLHTTLQALFGPDE